MLGNSGLPATKAREHRSPRRLRAIALFTLAYAVLATLDPAIAALPAFAAFAFGALALGIGADEA